MSGTYSPAPGAAPLAQRIRAQAAMETRLLLRNGEQVLLTLVIPVVTLIGASLAAQRFGLGGREATAMLTAGVLSLAIMSSAFTSIAIATGFERRAGLLRRLAVSPLGRPALLLGKVGAILVVEAIQLAVLVAVGALLGLRPGIAALGLLIPLVLLGTMAFAGLGLALAGAFRAEATLAIANAVNIGLMAAGATVLPRSAYGDAEAWLRWLPSAALGDSMRAALVDGHLAIGPVSILLGWVILGYAAATRWFRWD
ncbi:MAG: ABC transporter permease [Nocardioides sp.]